MRFIGSNSREGSSLSDWAGTPNDGGGPDERSEGRAGEYDAADDTPGDITGCPPDGIPEEIAEGGEAVGLAEEIVSLATGCSGRSRLPKDGTARMGDDIAGKGRA
ncbi:hypothetical protein Acor_77900 [Acrocarpospora corrugata]|uniref:Uncharacterized protein n=1 Tax=Acrocarpospora corrugata TaxID=35763 RepID=A0A5M3WCD7_9ACTN|nr:hypothetical protein Acor_77900 [Acrocarpospora corrugata]